MNAERPPATASAAVRAISYPGATSPYTRPSAASAHSPIANTAGSDVRHSSSTAIPPRSPSARPHSRASSSRGRTPAEKTTRSTASEDPSERAIPLTAPLPSTVTSRVPTPVRTVSPRPSTVRSRAAPPPSSTWTGMSRGANSTTWVASPSPFSAPAASRPNSPPPTTAPVAAPFAYASIARRSSIVRYTKQPRASLPGTGGTYGYEPVASTSVSYGNTAPDRAVTVRPARSTAVAGSPTRSSMPCRAMKSGSTRERSSGPRPSKYELSRTRS